RDQADADRRPIESRPKALVRLAEARRLARLALALRERRLHPLSLGDVPGRRVDQAFLGSDDRAPVEPAPSSVALLVAVDEVDRSPSGSQLPDLPLRLVPVVVLDK